MKLIIFFLFLSSGLLAQDREPASGKEKASSKESDKSVVYKYKKFEKLDLDDFSVEGESGSPGDLSITPRLQQKFYNKLPYRYNFHPEIRRSVDRTK